MNRLLKLYHKYSISNAGSQMIDIASSKLFKKMQPSLLEIKHRVGKSDQSFTLQTAFPRQFFSCQDNVFVILDLLPLIVSDLDFDL